jgi:uncharacterized membrane protein
VSDPARPSLFQRRWRLILAGAVGAGVGWSAHLFALPPGLSSLMGWNGACVAYLVPTLWSLFRDDEAAVRRRACIEDEGQNVTSAIVLSAVVASLGGTVLALQESKALSVHAHYGPPWAPIFSVSTLILGWVILQTVFTLRYAHRYFGDGDRDGEADGGVKFPGEAPTTYHDFIYMAVCVGATAQVSDFNITTSGFRRLVTLHAVLAFFFNTMVLALGINILATVIGQ